MRFHRNESTTADNNGHVVVSPVTRPPTGYRNFALLSPGHVTHRAAIIELAYRIHTPIQNPDVDSNKDPCSGISNFDPTVIRVINNVAHKCHVMRRDTAVSGVRNKLNISVPIRAFYRLELSGVISWKSPRHRGNVSRHTYKPSRFEVTPIYAQKVVRVIARVINHIFIFSSLGRLIPSIHQSIHPSIHPSVPPSIHPSIHPSFQMQILATLGKIHCICI